MCLRFISRRALYVVALVVVVLGRALTVSPKLYKDVGYVVYVHRHRGCQVEGEVKDKGQGKVPSLQRTSQKVGSGLIPPAL